MMRQLAHLLGLITALCGVPSHAQAPQWLHFTAAKGDFTLAANGQSARIVTAPGDFEVVRIAAEGLGRDIKAVSGAASGADGARAEQVWIGTLGHSPAIDALVAAGKLDAGRLKGAWESFLITVVKAPAPGVPAALVVVGSDRRGAAFGAYEVSRAIGVSPWHWWADVPPQDHSGLYVAPGAQRFGPPSVRYRGIYLNDEDWGLVPWARETFAPGEVAPGPRTYERVYDLLLRLKANMIWPAMHKISQPFNANPENAALADRYGIVVGSSHSEPMLRNNVGEWKGTAEEFNYVTNAEAVRAYWRERVTTNAPYETVWTLGQRGIHDSGMIGPRSDAEQRSTLERIFADQRAMLADAGLAHPPQVFTPYKEVLKIYDEGLSVPDDVTLVWPDDNFGYIRHFPDAKERARSGGAGVYYHLSYLGAPLSYLWLSTTPPALVREEMGRAYDLGARRLWIANVGDLKPAEMDTAYFLDLAWDVEGVRKRPIAEWTAAWAEENLGKGTGAKAAAIFADYYRLNFARRPEHLQWYLPGQRPTPRSPLTASEVDTRLAGFSRLVEQAQALDATIDPAYRDAFFELVGYPVQASAAQNRRVFQSEAQDRLRDIDFDEALRRGADALAADRDLAALTTRYNEGVANGKWRGMMAVEPADGQWRIFRTDPVRLPQMAGRAPPPAEPTPAVARSDRPVVRPADFVAGTGWRLADGLGREGAMLAALPASGEARATVTLPAGHWRAVIDLLPTYPGDNGSTLGIVARIDGREVTLAIPRKTGDKDWSSAVLDNRIRGTLAEGLTAGVHTFALSSGDPAVHVEAIRFEPLDTPAPTVEISPGANY